MYQAKLEWACDLLLLKYWPLFIGQREEARAVLTWHFAIPEIGGVPTLGVYTEKVKEGFPWS
jgi:hypothetical protein